MDPNYFFIQALSGYAYPQGVARVSGTFSPEGG
jgi:hypothetical protein